MKFFAPLNSEIQPSLQEIEVATFFQLPHFQIIGLPGPEVAEARERIRAAIEASGFEFPRRRVVVNLSPASIRKQGTGLDLAMALALLRVSWPNSSSSTQRLAPGRNASGSAIRIGAWGELSLEGNIKPAGQLTRVIHAAWNGGLHYLILSRTEMSGALESLELILRVRMEMSVSAREDRFPGDPPQLIAVDHLREAWDILAHRAQGDPVPSFSHSGLQSGGYLQKSTVFEEKSVPPSLMPLSPLLQRMVCAAVAGEHHIFLLGPKGAGKSHALEWLIALQMPPVSWDQLQNQLIQEMRPYFLAERPYPSNRPTRPVRRISPQVKPASLIGSARGNKIRPGELALAHGGILVADEFLEWPRDSREILREPLERGKVILSRVCGAVELPARFQFSATGNLCPCGGWPSFIPMPSDQEGKKIHRCRCPTALRKKYLAKLSGPIMDRIDLVAWVFQCNGNSVEKNLECSGFENLLEKITQAQSTLIHRWGSTPGTWDGAETEALIRAQRNFHLNLIKYPELSLRSRHKILRLALTFAALDGCEEPNSSHFSESYFYRSEQVMNSLFFESSD